MILFFLWSLSLGVAVGWTACEWVDERREAREFWASRPDTPEGE